MLPPYIIEQIRRREEDRRRNEEEEDRRLPLELPEDQPMCPEEEEPKEEEPGKGPVIIEF